MKNICFITQCSLPVPTVKGGAVETLVEYLLLENEKTGKYNFTVISIEDDEAIKQSNNYKYTNFVYVKNHNKTINRILLFAYRVLKHLKINIPFSLEFWSGLKLLKKIQNQDLFIYEAGPTTQIPRISKIVGKDNLYVHLHWDGMGDKQKDACFSKLISISEYIGNQWLKATNCDSSKIEVLPNCVNINSFSKCISIDEKNKIKEQLKIPTQNKVIIFTGRIVQDKGVKELLEAFNQIDAKNVTLLIVGSSNFGDTTNTPYEREVESIIKKSKKQVIAMGYVHHSQLYKYYSIADISVMPSIFQEPAGLVALEAQITGTPLIATRVGGIPEYVTEETTILVNRDDKLSISLKEKIDELLEDDNLREGMSRKGKEYASVFSTEEYYNNFSSIVNNI